jgi:hypothetical protein
MRLFVFCFFCFAFTLLETGGFAYDIKPYLEKIPSESENVLNFVFCPLNYQGNEIFFEDIDIIIERLGKTRPFDEFAGRIGFYYISLSREEENMIFKRGRGFPPLKVHQDFLAAILTRLKSNYKLIIVDSSGSVSCAELSSGDKISLVILGRKRYKNKSSFAKGFLHELGHSLGLRDECIDCQQLCPAGPPNCATTKEEAKEWWGDLAGKMSRVNYIKGCCGSRNYIRPTIASLMNDPAKAEDFGPVNERYLRETLEDETGRARETLERLKKTKKRR